MGYFCNAYALLPKKHYVIFGLVVISLALSMSAAITCRFLESDDNKYGLFSFYSKSNKQCTTYGREANFDTQETIARFFAVFSIFLISCATLGISSVILFISNEAMVTTVWRLCCGFLSLSTVCTNLIFCIFGSENFCGEGRKCSLEIGAIIALINSCILIVCTALSLLSSPPKETVFPTFFQSSRNILESEEARRQGTGRSDGGTANATFSNISTEPIPVQVIELLQVDA